MNPTSEQLDTLFKTAKERTLFCELSELKHKNAMLEIQIEELEQVIEKQIQFMTLLDQQIKDFLEFQEIQAISAAS